MPHRGLIRGRVGKVPLANVAEGPDVKMNVQPAGSAQLMPTNNAFVRRLRAIAVIDIVGYSKLMAAAEARTHARVNELFARVVDPTIQTYGGSRIERAGDGLIVLFESSTDAVRCALEIQRSVEAEAGEEPLEHRLRLRVGINVGDIIIDGEEIAGDDVNIAVRLQGLAEPGSVCISAAVRSQLHEELDSTFEDLGDVVLKNIGRPIRIYQVRRRERSSWMSRFGRASWWKVFLVRRWRYVVAGTAALAVSVAVVSSYWMSHVGPRPTDPPPMSVAVLPLVGQSLANDAAMPGRISESIAQGLAASGWLQVAGPDMVQRQVSETPATAALRSTLNVRYVVQGRVQSRDGKVVTELDLLDTSNGLASWTTRLTEDPQVNAQEIARNLVIQLREAIYDAESRRLFDSGGHARTAMEHKMLGDEKRQHFLGLAAERESAKHYRDSLALDANFVPSMISLAYSLLAERDLDPMASAQPLIAEADALSKRAVSRDSNSAPAWQLRSEALARQWMWDAALEASDRSIAIDSGRAFARGQRASLLVRLGRPKEALAVTDEALTLAEQRSGYLQFQRCRALMALGDYRAAAGACEKSLTSEEWWLQHAHLLAAYALLNDAGKVEAEKAKLLQLEPGLSIARVLALRQSNAPEFDQQQQAHLLRGLRSAGIAEGG